MAQPTSRLTYQELIRKIAKRAGNAYYSETGGKEAMVPIDLYDLYYCKDIAIDGIRMFMADAPRTGWRWQKRKLSVTMTSLRITGTADAADSTSLTDATLETTYNSNDDLNGYYIYITGGTGEGSFAQIDDYTASGGVISVVDWLDQYGNAAGTDPGADSTYAITGVETVGGDIARYPLPEYFSGEAAGKIEYAANSNHATPIEWRNESFIRTRRAVTVISSYPRYAAIRPLEPAITDIEDGSAKRRFEIIFDPQPSAAETVEFPYLLSFDNLKLESGKATGGGNTTLTDTAREESNGFFDGWRCEIIAGTGKGSYATVTGYVGSTGVFTVDDWLTYLGAAGGTDPAANSGYVVYPLNNHLPPGFTFDEGLLAACYLQLSIEDEYADPKAVDYYTQKALLKAYEADARLAPRQLGSMNTRTRRHDRLRRTWNDVTTDHDI